MILCIFEVASFALKIASTCEGVISSIRGIAWICWEIWSKRMTSPSFSPVISSKISVKFLGVGLSFLVESLTRISFKIKVEGRLVPGISFAIMCLSS